MSKLAIYKYVIQRDPLEYSAPSVIVPWYPESSVTHVAAQRVGDLLPTIWIAQPPITLKQPESSRHRFYVLATGEEFDRTNSGRFFGSAVCASGEFVWHVFGRSI